MPGIQRQPPVAETVPRSRLVPSLAGLIAAGAVFLGAAAPAWAGFAFGVTPTFPTPLSVGQAGVPASVTLTNFSTPPESSGTVTVSTTTLVASCGSSDPSSGSCPAASVDPGVLRLSPTGVGEAGTACAGTTFTNTVVDSTQGKYQLSPSTPIVLGAPGTASSVCTIDFTVDALKLPTKDASSSAGLQTYVLAYAVGSSSVGGSSAPATGNQPVTVAAPSVQMTTNTSAQSIPLGGSFYDTAVLTTSGAGPAPTGSVTFTVYGNDPTCSGAPVFSTTTPVFTSGGNTTAISSPFTPTTTGTYRVVATYSGDANYPGTANPCGEVGEQAVVTRLSPTVATQVSPASIPAGGSFHDTATLGGIPAGGPRPTGTVTFAAYGPNDDTCTGAAALTSTNPLNSNGTAVSANLSPTTPGTYRVVATYTGDQNYNATATACGDPNETVTVADELPSAAYTPSTYTPAVGQTVTFNGSASTDPDGTIVTYRWVWNDGTPDGSGPTASHAFTTTGVHSVGLYVTDSAGQTAAVGHGITVSADELPSAAYTPSTYTPAQGQTVSFNGSASSDPDGSIVTYRWVWNDGTPDGSGPRPTHVFTTQGTVSVALYVTDSDGQTAAVGHGITVGDDLPTAAYTPSTYTPTVGQTVTFNGNASSDPDGRIVTYRWVWNDGTPDGSGPTATHAFTTPGLRSVALYVTDSDGRTAAVGHGITVSGGAGGV